MVEKITIKLPAELLELTGLTSKNLEDNLLKIGKDANENLMNVDLDDIISKEV